MPVRGPAELAWSVLVNASGGWMVLARFCDEAATWTYAKTQLEARVRNKGECIGHKDGYGEPWIECDHKGPCAPAAGVTATALERLKTLASAQLEHEGSLLTDAFVEKLEAGHFTASPVACHLIEALRAEAGRAGRDGSPAQKQAIAAYWLSGGGRGRSILDILLADPRIGRFL